MEERKKVLKEAETEFEDLLRQTKGLARSDLALALGPLLEANRRLQSKKAAVVIIAAGLTILVVCMSGMAKLHLHALTRIALVQVLPWWDWRPLHHERCLVTNPHFVPPPSFSKDDCVACEAIDRVDRLADTTYQRLLDSYLQRNAPVIVVDAMEAWPAMRQDFSIDNITQKFVLDGKLKKTRPCALTSNIRSAGSTSDLNTLMTKLANPHLSKWFAHWLNCDSDAMKSMRQFYQRPYFLAPSVAPAHYNWVLMSSSYNAKHFKKLALESGLILLHQLKGSTHFRLYPLEHCEETCDSIVGALYEGEILVFLNYFWDFEYIPGKGVENIAFLTETAWDRFAIY